MKTRYRKSPIEQHNKDRLALLGQLIREFRTETFMSRQEFADKHQLSRSLLDAVESGQHNMTIMTILRISDALQVSPSELLSME